MNRKLENFILKTRKYCELPDENGVPECMRYATRIMEVPGKYTLAVCPECAEYLEKEARINKGRDK